MVICVVGQPGAGKDALAEHFVTKEIFPIFPRVTLSVRK